MQRDRILGAFAYCLYHLGFKDLASSVMRVNRVFHAIHPHGVECIAMHIVDLQRRLRCC